MSWAARGLHFLVRLWTGVPPLELPDGPGVYFANHGSHMDTIVVWAACRAAGVQIRPVAAADYWTGGLRGWMATDVLNAVLIQRVREERTEDPIAQMVEALDAGDRLLVFPEGTRTLPGVIEAFKGGLFALGERRPDVPLVPLYIRNAAAAWPKGSKLPLPLLCTLDAGEPIRIEAGEARGDFLTRARQCLIALSGGRLR